MAGLSGIPTLPLPRDAPPESGGDGKVSPPAAASPPSAVTMPEADKEEQMVPESATDSSATLPSAVDPSTDDSAAADSAADDPAAAEPSAAEPSAAEPAAAEPLAAAVAPPVLFVGNHQLYGFSDIPLLVEEVLNSNQC